MELRKANAILLVYSDHYSYERVGLFWMPYFRTLGLNVPVVLCASKSDLAPTPTDGGQSIADEMLAVMSEFKEIDSCIRTSAKEHSNVSEAFFLCQRAVTHPIAPLFDTKEAVMKPAAITALQRIFYLCDRDQDGRWNDEEIQKFQSKCFNYELSAEEVAEIKSSIQKLDPSAVDGQGIKESGFLLLNRIYIDRGRHETVWEILRKFHYTDSLSLKDSFLHPTLNAPPFSSTELSPLGYRFFADLFLLHDRDNDGGLNDAELAALFAPSSGPPPAWATGDFASSTVRDEAGHVTLQGWLALWSMTTLESASTTLEYLALLGFEHASGSAAAGIRVTRARHRHRRRGRARIERSVLLCYVVGGAGAGKTALLDAFLGRPLCAAYAPTIHPRSAVNAVELPGGKQCHLILKELGELEPAVLDNARRLDACDLVCYAYDSGDPESFAEVAGLHARFPQLSDVPGVFVALKADLDKAVQRADVQPDELAESLKVPPPVHVSVKWSSISELFTHVRSIVSLVCPLVLTGTACRMRHQPVPAYSAQFGRAARSLRHVPQCGCGGHFGRCGHDGVEEGCDQTVRSFDRY